MSDYMTDYLARMQRNDKALRDLANEVIKIDPTIEVYFYKDKFYHSSVLFFKGENINSISFHEVPYRWAGCGYTEHGRYHAGGDNVCMPFDVNDVLTTFHPVTDIKKMQPNDFFKSKEQYLKWYSFYEKYNK